MAQMLRVAKSPVEPTYRAIDGRLMTRVFYAFAILVAVSLAISFVGRWLGSSIAMAGYADDVAPREIVIGNNVITAPDNMIRFDRSRRDGVAARLDLYMRWPQLDGYSAASRDAFNHIGGARRILFLTFEEAIMSRDMSGRFGPIYASLIEYPGKPGESGLTLHAFTEKSGYLEEILAVGARPGLDPFVARCLVGQSGEDSLAPCERDIAVGNNLSLSYRFPRELLADWRRLDEAVALKAKLLLGTAR